MKIEIRGIECRYEQYGQGRDVLTAELVHTISTYLPTV